MLRGLDVLSSAYRGPLRPLRVRCWIKLWACTVPRDASSHQLELGLSGCGVGSAQNSREGLLKPLQLLVPGMEEVPATTHGCDV